VEWGLWGVLGAVKCINWMSRNSLISTILLATDLIGHMVAITSARLPVYQATPHPRKENKQKNTTVLRTANGCQTEQTL